MTMSSCFVVVSALYLSRYIYFIVLDYNVKVIPYEFIIIFKK